MNNQTNNLASKKKVGSTSGVVESLSFKVQDHISIIKQGEHNVVFQIDSGNGDEPEVYESISPEDKKEFYENAFGKGIL